MNDESNEVLERIIERIKYLTMKPYKNKAFRKHEEYKASILTNIIKEKFKISLSKAQ